MTSLVLLVPKRKWIPWKNLALELDYFEMLKRSKLDKETLWIILIINIRDECINLLNLMEGGYISHLSCEYICELCRHCPGVNINMGKVPKKSLPELQNHLGEESLELRLITHWKFSKMISLVL
jgi:hypothetical protein